MTRSTTRRLAIVSAAMTVAVAGCTGEGGQAPSSSSTSSDGDVEAAPANPGEGSPSGDESSPTTQSEAEREKIERQMAPGDVDSKQLAAVRSYLEVRENAESVRYEDPKAWESALKKVTTDKGRKTAVKSYRPARMSNARQVADRLGYEVKVVTGECTENPGFGGTESTVAVQCSLTDVVTDKDGKMVSTADVDITWPNFGKQDPPMLVLAKEGGKWLVDGDFTGRAS